MDADFTCEFLMLIGLGKLSFILIGEFFGGDIVAKASSRFIEAFTLQVQYAEKFQRCIGDVFLVETLYTLDFRQVFGHPDCKLFDVVLFLVIFT